MIYVNQVSNLFSHTEQTGENWQAVSVEEFNALRAAGFRPLSAVPESVTRRQLLLAVFRATGVKESDILAQIDAIPDGAARYEAQVEFTAATFARNNPLVASIGAALGLSTEQIDEIFRAAEQL